MRGHGFLAAVTFAPLRPSLGGDGAMGAAVADEAARQGVLVRAVGDTICLSPPLISTATEIAEITDRFRTAYEEVVRALLYKSRC